MHVFVFSDSGIESTTVLVSCGSNLVLRLIANNDDEQNDTTTGAFASLGLKQPISGVPGIGGSDTLIRSYR